MKKIIYDIWFILTLSVLFCACSDEDNESTRYIRLLPTLNTPDLRVVGNNFENGDRIGVYVVPYLPDNQTPGELGNTDYANNTSHQHESGSWFVESGGLLPWPGLRHIDVYAYYPYDASLANPRSYEFSIKENQSSVGDYNSSDLLWARNQGVAPSSYVPLTFTHRLSKININIQSEIVPVDQLREFTNVYLEQLFVDCTLDLANGAVVAGQTSSNQIFPLKLSNAASGYDLSLTLVVPPQSVAAATRLLRVENRGVNYYYTTQQPIDLRQGYTTTFNIEITEQGIVVTTGTISEWDDAGTIGGSTGGQAPRVVDLSAIDWNNSYVYYIYDGQQLIGQVCREYLSRSVTPLVDQLAEVVYPLDPDGKMDLTKGFVARVYNRTRNSVTNRYEYNTAAVHGGSALFGPKDTLYSYTQGSLALINKVRIESVDEISAAPDNYIATLDAQPYTLTDIDGNVYPITKIGTQYWIRENFRAERYADGSPLTVYYYNDNPTAYKYVYGALYTWYDAVEPAGIAPQGWRMPTDDDWYSIWYYVYPSAGRKLKALEGWTTIANADDVSGFAGLPGGQRSNSGAYNEINRYGQWWSSTSNSTSNAWRIYVDDGASITRASLNKGYCQSVRLLRDN